MSDEQMARFRELFDCFIQKLDEIGAKWCSSESLTSPPSPRTSTVSSIATHVYTTTAITDILATSAVTDSALSTTSVVAEDHEVTISTYIKSATATSASPTASPASSPRPDTSFAISISTFKLPSSTPTRCSTPGRGGDTRVPAPAITPNTAPTSSVNTSIFDFSSTCPASSIGAGQMRLDTSVSDAHGVFEVMPLSLYAFSEEYPATTWASMDNKVGYWQDQSRVFHPGEPVGLRESELWQPWPPPAKDRGKGIKAELHPTPCPSFGFSSYQVAAQSKQQWPSMVVPMHEEQKLSIWYLPRRTEIAIQLFCKGKGKFWLLLSSGPHKLLMYLSVSALTIHIDSMKERGCPLVELWEGVHKGIVLISSSFDFVVKLDCTKGNIMWNYCLQYVLELIMQESPMVAFIDISLHQLAHGGSALQILLTMFLSVACHGVAQLDHNTNSEMALRVLGLLNFHDEQTLLLDDIEKNFKSINAAYGVHGIVIYQSPNFFFLTILAPDDVIFLMEGIEYMSPWPPPYKDKFRGMIAELGRLLYRCMVMSVRIGAELFPHAGSDYYSLGASNGLLIMDDISVDLIGTSENAGRLHLPPWSSHAVWFYLCLSVCGDHGKGKLLISSAKLEWHWNLHKQLTHDAKAIILIQLASLLLFACRSAEQLKPVREIWLSFQAGICKMEQVQLRFVCVFHARDDQAFLSDLLNNTTALQESEHKWCSPIKLTMLQEPNGGKLWLEASRETRSIPFPFLPPLT